MPTRGRKPQPKVDHTPQPPKGIPRCPQWMDQFARNEWRRIVPMLKEMNLLAITDHALIETYCVMYSRWKQAEKELRENGYQQETRNGYLQPSPWLSIANNAVKEMQTCIDKLGLSPTGRQKLAVKDREPEEQEKWKSVISMAS